MNKIGHLLKKFRQLPEFERDKAISNILLLLKKTTDDVLVLRNEKIERDGPVCPYCNSNKFRRSGVQQQKQVFKCNQCGRYYRVTTNTLLYYLKKPELLPKYTRLMLEGKSLRQCAQEVGISLQTSFEWRHKILTALHQFFEQKKLKGIVEGHSIYTRYSNKGVHNAKNWIRYKDFIERKIRKNHGVVGILCAADRNNNFWCSTAGIDQINANYLKQTLGKIIERGSIFCIEKDRMYRSFCYEHKITYFPINKTYDNPIKGIYHIHNVTQKFLDVDMFLNIRYKGVSTKYLQNYLQLYLFTTTWYEYMLPAHVLLAFAAESNDVWTTYKKYEKMIM